MEMFAGITQAAVLMVWGRFSSVEFWLARFIPRAGFCVATRGRKEASTRLSQVLAFFG